MSEISFAFDERAFAVDSIHAQTAIYTSRGVVDGLLDRVGWPSRNGQLLDPSCGDGAFLVAAMERLSIRKNDMASLARVHGLEIHPGAVADARDNIANWLQENGWDESMARRAAFETVTEGDFLVDDIDARDYSVIIGNPPYLRYAYVPAYFQSLYRDRLPAEAQGDLMHGFLFRCTRMLHPDGVVAMVTADRWAFNETASGLRERLGEIVSIGYVARLDCTTSFYRPKRRVTGSLPRVHPIEVLLHPKAAGGRPLTAAPILIDEEIVTGPTGRTLADVADIRLAPWLSKPGTYFIPRAVADGLETAGYGGAKLVSAVEGKERDIDWAAEAVRPQTAFVAIVTTRDQEPTGSVAKHLKDTYWMHSKRAKRNEWWLPPEIIRDDYIHRPKLMVQKIDRTLRAALVPAGTLVTDHQIMIFPKNGTTFDEIVEILARPESQTYWRNASKPIENGFYQTGAGVIKNLPI